MTIAVQKLFIAFEALTEAEKREAAVEILHRALSLEAADLSEGKSFAVTKLVQLQINGQPPAGLQDGAGRLIDGDHNGTPGGNAVAILSRGGASIEAIASGTTSGRDVGIMAIVDALFEQNALAGLTTAHRARRR